MVSPEGIEPSTSQVITLGALSLSYRPVVGWGGVEPPETPTTVHPVSYLIKGKFERYLR